MLHSYIIGTNIGDNVATACSGVLLFPGSPSTLQLASISEALALVKHAQTTKLHITLIDALLTVADDTFKGLKLR